MITQTLPEYLDQLMSDLDIEPIVLATALRVSPRTIERWMNTDTLPQKDQRLMFERLDALRTRLVESLGSKRAARVWFHTDNAYLRGMKPVEVLASGRLDVVEAAIAAYDAAVYV
jgi:hypothetical protein